jgi:hypothetical protein
MNNSIQHFLENGTIEINKVRESFAKNPKDTTALILGVQKIVNNLGLDMIQEVFNTYNQYVIDSYERKAHWDIVKHDRKKLITSMGTITYTKTLFKNRETGERAYLLDRLMGLDPHERLTEDAEARLLEEAVQTSYQKAGTETCQNEDFVSKQTVKNKIHKLEFPKEQAVGNKKVVEYLYIDADEDHISLQYQNKKGDLITNEHNRKNNCVMGKLVYVYEGVEKEAPESTRHRLINPHYFSGVYNGAGNTTLWEEVREYIEGHYDTAKIKKIYINADGGAWIKAGKDILEHAEFVLDEFHLNKYLTKLTSHLYDSAEEERSVLRELIKTGSKKSFKEEIAHILEVTEDSQQERIIESCNYILSNWSAAKVRMSERRKIVGSSTEAHVSHVLSARLSSRPMGWSRTGADKMAHLRAYKRNGGSMLELVHQQRELSKTANTEAVENDVLSLKKVLCSEKEKSSELGKYAECMRASVSYQTREKFLFRTHLAGL